MTNEPISCPKCNQPLSQVGQFWICPQHGQVSPDKPVVPMRIFLSYGHDSNEELVRRRPVGGQVWNGAMLKTWRTVRVFVSSTSRDMQVERTCPLPRAISELDNTIDQSYVSADLLSDWRLREAKTEAQP